MVKTVLTVLGTRPEAIKLAPVLNALAKYPQQFRSVVCVSGQHRELLAPMLRFFDIRPDMDLALMQDNQSLNPLTARMLTALNPVLRRVRPDWIVVQGDTTTVMTTALAAYYRRIKVAHVEAGLRTADKYAPFPEEMNRRIVGALADLHFAPTARAERNLRREGVAADRICCCGNTVVDALLWTARQPPPTLPEDLPPLRDGMKRILVTGHRRENFGAGMESVCLALRDIANQFQDCELVYPVHFNPHVREPVSRILGHHPRIHLVDPVEYPVMVHLLKQAWLVLTDSGGLQEEAPTFKIPCLVMREKTERPEGVQAGVATLVGTDRRRIVQCVEHLYRHPAAYRKMAVGANPYGDGSAADIIVKRLRQESA